ncbi:MAG: GNAT family N-acetyltransferase [Oscillospiraceae bacterium]|jgi:GNAT superfamily N-acetyltransferase
MKQEIKILTADLSMIPSLRHLWKQCFGDTDAYLSLFFNRRFSADRTLTAWMEDTLAGAVYLLEAELEGRPLWYGYAVGTLPEYRGQGISRRLHETVFHMAAQRGALYAVHPQSEDLIAFYENLGLHTGFFYKRVTLTVEPGDNGSLTLTPLSAASYTALRDGAFAGPGFVRWDESAVAYAVEENAFCGGFCRALTDGESVWALFGNVQDDVLFLRETTMPDDVICRAAPLLAKEFGRTTIVLRLPVSSHLEGTIEMSGMIRGENSPECGYLNLMLD